MTGSIVIAVTWAVMALVWSFLFGYETKRRQIEQAPADKTTIMCDIILIILSLAVAILTFVRHFNG